MDRRSLLRQGFGLVWGVGMTLAQVPRPWTPDLAQAAVRPLGSGGLARVPDPPVRGLADWFGARFGDPLANGTRVATWINQASGPNATQATSGKQPAFETNVIGGLPALRFSNSRNDFLATASGSAMAEPTTIIAVIKSPMADPPATQYILEGEVNQRRGLFYSTARKAGLVVTAGQPLTGAIASGSAAIVTAVANGGNSLIRWNGVQTAARDTGATTSPTRMVIGADFTTLRSFDGWIAEVLRYDRHLSAAEMRRVESYLAGVYGLERFVAGQFYVDSVFGSASNHGRLASNPKATLTDVFAGYDVSEGDLTVDIVAPLASPLREGPSWTKDGRVTLRPASGQETAVIRACHAVTGWTPAGGGVWSKALGADYPYSAVFGVKLPDVPDADGYWTRMTVASPASTTTPAAGKFGYTGTTGSITLYVHLPDGSDPNATTVEVDWYNTAFATFFATGRSSSDSVLNAATLTDMIFEGGASVAVAVGAAGSDAEGHAGTLVATNCIARYSPGSGFAPAGGYEAVTLTDCIGEANGNDGLNVHNANSSGGTVSVSRPVDAMNFTGRYNRDEGASYHETTRGTLTGGRLHHNDSGGATHVNSANVAMIAIEIDHNQRNNPGAGTVGDSGGVNYLDTTSGAVTGCDVHDNPAEGIKALTAADVAVSGNTSGTAAGNGLPDNLSA